MKGEDPQSLPMLNGDFEASSLVRHHQEQLGYEDQELEEDGKEEEEEERSKLDEGFYEIEAVRRKRIRKGQLQYLIKWRGWPETANTWEPLENLQSCSDVIDAFEESLRSGKHSGKRKRKLSASIPQPKKKQLWDYVIDPFNGTRIESDEILPRADPFVPHQSASSSQGGEMDGDVVTLETSKLHDVNGGFANVDTKVYGSRERSEYEVPDDKLAIQLHETKISEGSVPSNIFTNVDCVEPTQNNRLTGAKRRKPSSVKRFKQDLASRATNMTIDPDVSLEQPWHEKRGAAEDCSTHKDTYDVIQIIQPISYSASVANNVQDVSVRFTALRPDGKEVIVDNKFLKDTNPLLLIDFYEQHIKYNPIP